MFNGANNAIQDNNCCLFFLLLVYIANNTDPEQTAPLADQHVRIQSGHRESGHPPPFTLKNHKNIGFLKQYWSGSPEKSQSYQASIQCWAIICTPAKRHLNVVSLAGRRWPHFSGIWIQLLTKNKKKKVGPPLKKLSGSAQDQDSYSICFHDKISMKGI